MGRSLDLPRPDEGEDSSKTDSMPHEGVFVRLGASVATDAHLNFFLCRDIEEGEDLTIEYAQLSRPPG